MCGKAKSKITPAEIVEFLKNLDIMEEEELNGEKYYENNTILDIYDNIIPGNTIYAAYLDKNSGFLEIEEMKWGLNSYGGQSNDFIFNTRSESFLDKKTLSIFKNNRAIIFINGFYEKYKIDNKKTKNEYFITNKKELLIIPVIYQTTQIGKKLFTILTKNASKNIDEIHNRQPVILKDKFVELWLKINEYDTYNALKLSLIG